MLARVVRSGVTESIHDGAIAVVDVEGRVIAAQGDLERVFFARSSVKPFQAHVSQTSGAALPPEWLAVASSSHDGTPTQLGIVRVMLESAGLTESDLGCPPGWPLAMSSRSRLLLAGQARPLRIFHNCSGKHAGFLRACLASGWDSVGYLSPSHPIQARVRDLLEEVTGERDVAVGVDGCGAPTFAISTLGLARAFARLGNDERFGEVFTVMHRYPRLVSGVGRADGEVAIATHSAAKGGAEGSLGIAVRSRGAIAMKVLDGSDRAIGPVASAVMSDLGWITPRMGERLAAALRVPMSGGGRDVGSVEPLVDLVHS